MDPVSIAGAVGPTLKTLYTITTTLYTFITSAKKVDKSLENLHVDVRGLTRVLEDIETFLKDVIPGTEGAWDQIYNAIHDTRRTIKDLQKILDGLGPASKATNAFKKTVKQVQLNLNSDEISNIRSRVQWHSTALQMALQTATLTIDCRTNDNLINIVNPKIDRMLSLIEQVQKLSSQLTAKFDKLPKDFQTPGMTEYSQRLKRTAEAAIVTASTVLESQSTIVGGEAGQQPPSSSSGELSEDQRKRKIEEWISNLTVSHGEREQEYDILSELTPDDSISSIGMNRNRSSQQTNEAGIPGPSSAADKSAGTPKQMSTGRTNLVQNIFEEGFAHLSQDQEISSSREEPHFDQISENTLTDYRADRKVDTSYDEKSAKELLAVLGAKFDATKWKANELLLDLAKMEVGCGVRSNSNIVGTVLYLLEKGADVNAMNAESQTPLYCASEVGNTAVVELLVKKNADFNIKDEYGWTALHIAASRGRTPVVEILLKSGVDVEQETKSHRFTALAIAASNGRTSTVECLLKAGASIDARDNEARTSLRWASSKGHVGVVEVLLKAGAALNLQDKYGWTALTISAYWGHKTSTELLLAAGADIRARSTKGDTVLHLVLRKHLVDCAKDKICAFCTGSETRQDMVKLICENGADPSALGQSGQSPLSMVYEEGVYSKNEQEALTKVLKKFGAKSPGPRR